MLVRFRRQFEGDLEMKASALFLALVLLSQQSWSHTLKELSEYGRDRKELAAKVLNSPLNEKTQRPPGKDSLDDPVEVGFSTYITELSMCEKWQTLTASGYLRQFWTDPRLATEDGPQRDIYQATDMFVDRKIWIPDTFIVESTKGFLSEGDSGRTFLRLYSDGFIKSSIHFQAKITCPVSRATQAGEKLTCRMTLESYGYSSNDVKYFWKENIDDWDFRVSKEATEQLANDGWKGLNLRTENNTVTVNELEYTSARLIFELEKL